MAAVRRFAAICVTADVTLRELEPFNRASYHHEMRRTVCISLVAVLCSSCLQEIRPLGSTTGLDKPQGVNPIGMPTQTTGTPSPSPSWSQAPNSTPIPVNGRCADTHVLLCDSFETQPAGSAPDSKLWSLKTQSPNDIVRVDDSRAHNGVQSLWVHTQTGSYEIADIVNKSVPAVANSVIYGGAYVYMTANLPSTHISLVTAGSPLPNNNYTWVRYGGQFGILMINYQPDTGTESWQHSDTAMPLNQWVCIQFYYNGNTTEARFWLNDVEIPKLYLNQQSATVAQGAPPGVWSMPDIDTITLGWEHYPSDSGTDGMDIWYDDVALDTNFIPCNP